MTTFVSASSFVGPTFGRLGRDFIVLKSIIKYSSRGQGTFDPYFVLEKASPFTPPI
jgi:hypothetical protein